MSRKENNAEVYKRQGRLTLVNLAGEIPNFLAICVCYISTRTVLLLVDLIDTGSNILRNLFVLLTSKLLRKDQRFRYNYGNGKIEAMAGLVCDLLLLVSLLIALGVAVHDILYPQLPSTTIWLAVCLKVINLSGDIFIYWRQHRLRRTSNSTVIQATLRAALKNLIFDSISLSALLLMMLFGKHSWIAYVSPVCSIFLSGYLLFMTVKQIPPVFYTLLDKTADEQVQMEILKSLVSFYDQYELLSDIRSHVVGDQIIIDLELEFPPQTSYGELQTIADAITGQISEKYENCSVSLSISGKHPKKV